MTNPTTRYGHIEPEHQGKTLHVKEAGPGEVEHHGGSFRKYMDNKNRKLQEQFDQQSAVAAAYGDASGQITSTLFSGVSITVNGFTTPSQQDLKQIMAQHGGNFEIYYHRARITHIICSNLTDAKVKIFQRERNPTPVVRPEWIVDSLKAGVILPLEEYVLWRLRDVPGQRTLSAFRQQPGTALQATEKPMHIAAALPPSPYGKFAALAADLSSHHAVEPDFIQPHNQHNQKQALPDKQPSAYEAAQGHENAARLSPHDMSAYQHAAVPKTGPAKALNFDLATAPQAKANVPHEAEPDYLADTHAFPGRCAAAIASSSSGQTSEHAQDTSRPFDNPIDVYADPAWHDEGLHKHERASVPRRTDAMPDASTDRATAPAVTAPPADDYRLAYERAAAARAACDLLRGPPKSSRDDPHFMDSYYKSSRLSFIGRWKARIEALTATMAAQAPVPQAAYQPSALVSAFKGGKVAEAPAERGIIHLDMDCFFASVAALAEPSFKGKPLAVSHSNSAQGTGEISSANYEARKFGIHASMFIARAKKRCPHLIVMPYQFDKYEEVSEQVYRILLKATACVQPVSCDEAYLDVTGLGDPEQVASSIRQQIFDATGCTASAGIGPTMLVARLATKKGKPNGQYRIQPHQVDAYLLDLEVEELPGVGWNICQKLKELGIASVRDVRASTKDVLQREIGAKTGGQVWAFAHGVDDRIVEPPKSRKSVGAECNWGIRFQNDSDALAFMEDLAGELSTRMKAAGVRGRTVSLKLKRRKTNAPDPPKFMGHGDCDNMSRSVTLSRFTDAASELGSQGKALLRALRVDPTQIRGIGLNVTKLDTDPASAAAKPGGAAPSKVAAPPPSTHDPKTGPWVRFWQDKPQHWGPPPTVKSAVELADTDRIDASTAGVISHFYQGQALHAEQGMEPAASLEQKPSSVAAAENVEGGLKSDSRLQPAAASLAASVINVSTAGASALAAPAEPDLTPPLIAAPAVASAKVPIKRPAFNMYSPSKRTLGILHKPLSRQPSPRKQVPLDEMLSRQVAAAQARATEATHSLQQREEGSPSAQLMSSVDTQGPEPAGAGPAVHSVESDAQTLHRVVLPHAGLAPVHSHQHSRLQGLTLSQIDASVFAALPDQHQQELLQNLPKNTDRIPAGSAMAAASDFAFVTKLANLQKTGHAQAVKTATSSQPAGVDPCRLSQAEAIEFGDSGTFTDRSGAASGVFSASAMESAPGQSAEQCESESGVEQAEVNSQRIPTCTQDPANVNPDAAVWDDVAYGRAGLLSDERSAHHSNSGIGPEALAAELPDLAHTAGQTHGPEAVPNLVQQSAEHAQQHDRLQQALSACEESGQPQLDAQGEALDLDLMEEERTALAMHGQPRATDSRMPDDGQVAASKGHHQELSRVSVAWHGSDPLANAAHIPGAHPHAVSVQQAPHQQQIGQRSLIAGVTAQQAVAALPPASQIDASVLDALPLEVRRELELAYGLAPRRSPNKAGKRHTAAPTKAVPNKKQRVLDPPQNLARQAGRLAAHSRMTDVALSFTQVDPAVLSELPQELQDELAALLPSTSRAALHGKHAQAVRHTDMHHPAATRLNLLRHGHRLGNQAFVLEPQHASAEAGVAKEAAVDSAMSVPATELWAELQAALHTLSGVTSSTEAAAASDAAASHSTEAAEQKMEALSRLIVQWAQVHVHNDLEGVHYLLRRLADFESAAFIQLSIAKMVAHIQQEVQTVHGAKLCLQSFFV